MMTVVGVGSPSLMGLWVGGEHYLGATVLVCLVLSNAAALAAAASSSAVLAMGSLSSFATASVVEAVVRTGLVVVGYRVLGIAVLPLATMVALLLGRVECGIGLAAAFARRPRADLRWKGLAGVTCIALPAAALGSALLNVLSWRPLGTGAIGEEVMRLILPCSGATLLGAALLWFSRPWARRGPR